MALEVTEGFCKRFCVELYLGEKRSPAGGSRNMDMEKNDKDKLDTGKNKR